MNAMQRQRLLFAFALVGSLFACQRARATTISSAKALPVGTVVTLNNVVISTTIDLISSIFA
jgi:hypothetical protein